MIKLTPKQGYKYIDITNNRVFEGDIYLSINESPDDYQMITEEEAAIIIKENKRKEYAEQLKDSLAYLYEQEMAKYEADEE